MNPSRRNLLATIVVSGGAATIAPLLPGPGPDDARAAQSGSGPFDPWSALRRARPGDPTGLVAAAILAASPHNTQPWSFVVEEGLVTLRADPARDLGSFDPDRREMWIGLGCAVENVVRAGPGLGFEITPHLANDPGRPMPRIELACARRQPAPDGALALIGARRTNRAAYAAMPIAASILARLSGEGAEGRARIVLFPADSAAGRRFAAETVKATEWITRDAVMAEDSHRWFRGNLAEVTKHRDGLSIPTSGLSPALTFLGQLLPAPDTASEGRYWVDATRHTVAASPTFGMIKVADLYDRAQQVEAGRVWQRLHLEATAAGLAAQPLNQLPEVVDRQRQLGHAPSAPTIADGIAGGDGHVTFCFRLGHPLTNVPHSARRGLDDVVSRRG